MRIECQNHSLELHRYRGRGAVAPERDGHGLSRRDLRDDLLRLLVEIDRLAVDRGDDVAGNNAGARRGAAGRDGRDEKAARRRETVSGGKLWRRGDRHEAECDFGWREGRRHEAHEAGFRLRKRRLTAEIIAAAGGELDEI